MGSSWAPPPSALELVACLALFLQPALALVDRAPGANVLVVEGWLPRHAMAAAVAEYRRGGYERVYTIGVPFRSDFEPDAKGSYASSGAGKLRDVGMPAGVVIPVPSRSTPQPKFRGGTGAARLPGRPGDEGFGHQCGHAGGSWASEPPLP